MIWKVLSAVGLSLPLRLVRITLTIFSIIAAICTFLGIITGLATHNDVLAEKLLSIYPRYTLAMGAWNTFKDMKYPLAFGTASNKMLVGVELIDDPSWGVLLDFLKSDIAFRKSERSEAVMPPSPARANPIAPPSPPPLSSAMPSGTTAKSSTPEGSAATTEARPAPTPQVAVPLPPVDFGKIKTVTSFFNPNVPSAGPKALVPPYNLIVFWPGIIPRRIYEFLSFEEFRLDLRNMMIDEIVSDGVWLSLVAFACGIVLNALRALVSDEEKKRLAARISTLEAVSAGTHATP